MSDRPKNHVQEFIEECEAYQEAAGIAKLATLSTKILGRGSTLDELKAGKRTIMLASIRRARAWMEANPAETYRERFKPGRPKGRKS